MLSFKKLAPASVRHFPFKIAATPLHFTAGASWVSLHYVQRPLINQNGCSQYLVQTGGTARKNQLLRWHSFTTLTCDFCAWWACSWGVTQHTAEWHIQTRPHTLQPCSSGQQVLCKLPPQTAANSWRMQNKKKMQGLVHYGFHFLNDFLDLRPIWFTNLPHENTIKTMTFLFLFFSHPSMLNVLNSFSVMVQSSLLRSMK